MKTETKDTPKRVRKVPLDICQFAPDCQPTSNQLSEGQLELPDGTRVWVSNIQCQHCHDLSTHDDPIYCWFDVGKAFVSCWQCGQGHGNPKAAGSDTGTGCTAGKLLKKTRSDISERFAKGTLPKLPDADWCFEQQSQVSKVIPIERLVEVSVRLKLEKTKTRPEILDSAVPATSPKAVDSLSDSAVPAASSEALDNPASVPPPVLEAPPADRKSPATPPQALSEIGIPSKTSSGGPKRKRVDPVLTDPASRILDNRIDGGSFVGGKSLPKLRNLRSRTQVYESELAHESGSQILREGTPEASDAETEASVPSNAVFDKEGCSKLAP